MKISVTIDDRLLNKIDEFAESKFMTRSAFLALAADTYMNQQIVMEMLPKYLPDMMELAKVKQIQD